MALLFPVDKVAAVEYGHTGEISESGSHKIIVAFTICAYGRVGIPSGENGVVERTVRREGICGVVVVVALVGERAENRMRLLRFDVGRCGGAACSRSHEGGRYRNKAVLGFHGFL